MGFETETKPTHDSVLQSVTLPTFLRHRHVADVPEDVEDPYLAHLNDPNWDMNTVHSISSDTDVELGKPARGKFAPSTEKFGRSNSIAGQSLDQEDSTQFDSASRTDTTAVADVDYNELVLNLSWNTLSEVSLVNRRILKCERPCLASMILACPLTPSGCKFISRPSCD